MGRYRGSRVSDRLAYPDKGTSGRDTYDARGGDDYIDGGPGADTMKGGPGNDTYVIDDLADKVIERAGEGTDHVWSAVDVPERWLPSNVEDISLLDSAAIAHGSNDPNVIQGGSVPNVLYGYHGADRMVGHGGYDTLYGGTGADQLFGGFYDSGELAGDDSRDDLYGDTHNDKLYGGGGSDYLYGGPDHDLLRGGLGGDSLYGEDGYDQLYGESGYDDLFGGPGYDRLYGGPGNDMLSGEGYGDRLSGGPGADHFIYESGDTGKEEFESDTITDFSRGEGDKIDLSAIDADTGISGDQTFIFVGQVVPRPGECGFSRSGADTWIEYNVGGSGGGDNYILLQGARLDMAATDFIL